jgi:hypothetical protein
VGKLSGIVLKLHERSAYPVQPDTGGAAVTQARSRSRAAARRDQQAKRQGALTAPMSRRRSYDPDVMVRRGSGGDAVRGLPVTFVSADAPRTGAGP